MPDCIFWTATGCLLAAYLGGVSVVVRPLLLAGREFVLIARCWCLLAMITALAWPVCLGSQAVRTTVMDGSWTSALALVLALLSLLYVAMPLCLLSALAYLGLAWRAHRCTRARLHREVEQLTVVAARNR